MIDTCVCCGEYVPEGRMVCPLCVDRYMTENNICKFILQQNEAVMNSGSKKYNRRKRCKLFAKLLTNPIK